MTSPISVRPFEPDDAGPVDRVLATAFADEPRSPRTSEAIARGSALISQMGSALLVAERDGEVAGAVRWWQDEGVAWFDLLASERPPIGRQLIAAVEARAQDHGLRLVRIETPEWWLIEEYFGRAGYLPVQRSRPGSTPAMVTLEKRLPLLTVREQRRADAAEIGRLSGEDPWPFEQGQRPGWFVLADGQRIGGVIAIMRGESRDAAMIRGPWLDPSYRSRGLEIWMADRAAQFAAMNGYTSIALAAPGLEARRRDFEERRWFLRGTGAAARYVRQLDDGEIFADAPQASWE